MNGTGCLSTGIHIDQPLPADRRERDVFGRSDMRAAVELGDVPEVGVGGRDVAVAEQRERTPLRLQRALGLVVGLVEQPVPGVGQTTLGQRSDHVPAAGAVHRDVITECGEHQ